MLVRFFGHFMPILGVFRFFHAFFTLLEGPGIEKNMAGGMNYTATPQKGM
jgi:hypothetical protein